MQAIKIHQPTIDTIIVCLKSIFEEQKVADKVVGNSLKQNKKFGSRDRSFIAESVYDIVRWKLKYQYQLANYNTQFTLYKHLILVSLLNRNYAIINPEIFDVTATIITDLIKIIEQPILEKHIEQSFPELIYNLGLESIGNNWHQIAMALNQQPSVFIRANTLKISKTVLVDLLRKQALEINECHDLETNAKTNAIQILSKNNLKNTEFYKNGFFEFQDLGSQEIGCFLFSSIHKNTNLNELNILDLCAGAGGKTLHLSALLNNKGKIFATDYNAARLENLKLRINQAGCKNITIIDFKAAKQLKNIDIILIDAPCSGTGTFKRQPDLKYKISLEKINNYQTIQAGLLKEYQSLLTKNGKIIYATCSILPQENEIQILKFLEKNPNFTLQNSQQLLPTNYAGDGFYMACLSLSS